MNDSWSREEVEATVADYFAMLQSELLGERYNKAGHRTRLLALLRDRSPQSVEFKHGNISAVLLQLGFPYISGYKPRSNYQHLLREVVQQQLAHLDGLRALAARDAEAVPAVPTIDDILSALTTAPKGASAHEVREPRHGSPGLPRSRSAVNYIEREARNRGLGLAGEQFVLRFEQARLLAAGRDQLAGKVEHVSSTRGDGLGFDILSFEPDGVERLLEVKTTKYGIDTPFYVSGNEVDTSEQHPHSYQLCRVFDFRTSARLFKLDGRLRACCSLDPVSYVARVA